MQSIRHGSKRIAATVALATATLVALAGCSTPADTTSGGDVGPDNITLAYIVKFGSVSWFVAENEGVQAASAELGITTRTTDVEDSSEQAISAIDTAIAQGASGLLVVAPNQDLGPAIIQKAENAGIPIIAIDDPLTSADGEDVPFVGFDAEAIGTQVGEELAILINEAGIDPADIKIASVEDQKTPVCMARNQAAQAALEEGVPGITADNVINIPYNNDLDSAITAVAPIATANPDVAVWVSYSCNDDGVLGAWRALAAAGVSADQFFGVGIGGHLACQAFSLEETGFRGALYVDSTLHGSTAVELMYDFLVNGTPIPAKTIIPGVFIDRSNYEDYVSC